MILTEENRQEFRCMLLLYLIALWVEETQPIYDLLNIKLKPSDNRGEAFYATNGEFHRLVSDTERGRIPPEFFRRRLEELFV